MKEVWPRIRDSCPRARLIIAGDYPDRIGYPQNNGSGIELTGFVDDLDALYQCSRIAVVPISAGSGTRIKIIEVAAQGKPIVITAIGAEGIEMRDGHELMIRNTADAFAQACIQLFERPSVCEQLGLAGQAAVSLYYDRRHVVSLIQSRIHNAVNHTAAAS